MAGETKLSNEISALIQDDMSDRIIETAKEIAIEFGIENLNVRKILQRLNITNRVFYNRFHNIDEVLEILYEDIVLKIRESIISKFEPDKDFFEQVIDIVANTLVMSYKLKTEFNNYVFENDSISDRNYLWWKGEIKKIIEFGKENNYLRDVDSDVMSYAIWCFIRGYNADAIGRKLSMEDAVNNFKYSFNVLLDGMRSK
ncbi:MAG: TetR/AcrR family transcriptional regulator [Ruminococcaceae bacterium]|nr:TetR/AcrR family transcriptional regulator [Oscillospiraceae bacterium]